MRKLLVLLVVAVAVVVAVKPARVAAQTVMLVPSLMDAPVRPLDWISAAPTRTSLPYRGSGSSDLSDLWLPAGAGRERRVGAALLVFGVNNVGRDHPAIRRVAEALARTGVAVLVPDSSVLLAGRLDTGEVDGVVRAFQTLAARPEVDPGRVGIIRFSAGGSLALVAAADERIRGRIRYVNAFGAFADARSYVASLAAHAYRLDGRTVEWTPTRLALEGYPRLVLAQVGDSEERQLLVGAVAQVLSAGGRPRPDAEFAGRLSGDARAIYRVLVAQDLPDAERAIAQLPPQVRRLLDGLSPVRHLDGLRTKIYLMHELDDHHVPWVESRRLADELAKRGLLARHTEFRLFTHVQPDDVDALAAAPELWKLLWHVDALMLETL